MAISEIATSDTPCCRHLKHSVRTLKSELAIEDQKLKSIRQTVRRQHKKIATLKMILNQLKKKI